MLSVSLEADIEIKMGLGGIIKLHMLTVKILKFGTPQTIAIIVLKIEMFDVTLH